MIGCYLLSISFLFNCYKLEFFFICSSYFTFQCYGSAPFKHRISPKECSKQKYHNYCHADVPSCVLKMVSHNLCNKIKTLLAETCSLVFSTIQMIQHKFSSRAWHTAKKQTFDYINISRKCKFICSNYGLLLHLIKRKYK